MRGFTFAQLAAIILVVLGLTVVVVLVVSQFTRTGGQLGEVGSAGDVGEATTALGDMGLNCMNEGYFCKANVASDCGTGYSRISPTSDDDCGSGTYCCKKT